MTVDEPCYENLEVLQEQTTLNGLDELSLHRESHSGINEHQHDVFYRDSIVKSTLVQPILIQSDIKTLNVIYVKRNTIGQRVCLDINFWPDTQVVNH